MLGLLRRCPSALPLAKRFGDGAGTAYREEGYATGGQAMAMRLNHVHLKTRDPQQTAKFYMETLGATMVSEIGARGYRLNLHGLTLNITTLIEEQKRQQHYGVEHFALDTDDLDGTVAKLKANGARVLEEMVGSNGRRICFLEGPDGVQLEIIEMKG
jgi:catechol 2,3-dioxygenase-like lactoylglutathione lyase family enzyme